jgi:CRISP-associated protein Cas1
LMASLAALEEEMDEDAAWAQRGRYWEGEAAEQQQAPQRPLRRRKSEPKPLVLNGHGVRLRIHQGSLVVQNGFTHYPQERQELRLFPGDQRLPSRLIMLDSDGSISLDVIKWLSQQGIPLVLLNWQGEVVSVVGDGTAYDPDLCEAQLAAQKNGRGLQVSTQLIRDKIINSRATLQSLPSFLGRDLAISKLEAILDELNIVPPESIEALRLVEARAALAYFTCWQLLPLNWKGTGRRPIPPEWHYVGVRQSLFSSNNRHATHPVNAMLNYAYGVLESHVRIATVSEGLDPSIGYLHARRPGRAALVYDLMEPLRPQVDRKVLSLVLSHTLAPSDFVMETNGVCRLHPQLARGVAELTASDSDVRYMILSAVRKLRAVPFV